MKKLSLLLLGGLLSTAVLAGTPESKTANIATDLSKVKWTGSKIAYSHTGTMAVKEGSIMVDGKNITGGKVVMDMTSVKNTDIEDKEKNKQLIGHLSSPDFFDIANHPTATFSITSVKPMTPNEEGHNSTIEGTLTIKGITNTVSFPAKVAVGKGKVAAMGKISFDRSKWSIKYGSGSFFDDLGDNLISDTIELDFKIVAPM